MTTSAKGPAAQKYGVSLERRALRDSVYEAILEILLENQLSPGDSLSIDGLARDLGVSHTPVREALAQLEHTGLVTREALKGYRVAPPLGPERMAELLGARCVIEVAAVRALVPTSEDVLVELENAHDQHEMAARRVRRMAERNPDHLDWSTMRKYYRIDWDFHLIVLQNCGNRYLLEMAESLAPDVHRLRQSVMHGAIDVEAAHVEHTRILEAIRTADADAAAVAMADHLGAVAARAALDG